MMRDYFLGKVDSVLDGNNLSKSILLIFLSLLLIAPFQELFIWLLILHTSILDYLTHLSIEECISYYHFLVLNVFHKLTLASE